MNIKTNSIKRQMSEEKILLDYLLNFKLDSEGVQNSETAIKTICDALDELRPKKDAYSLISITSNKNTLLHLIVKSEDSYHKYSVVTWRKTETIEKGISATKHESGNEEILDWAVQTAVNLDIYRDGLIDHLVGESLTGYCISKKKFIDQYKFLSSNGKKETVNLESAGPNTLVTELADIYKHIESEKLAKRKEVKNIISNFVQKLNCDKLKLNIVHWCIANEPIYIGKITKVLQNDNNRIYQMKIFEFHGREKKIVTQHTLISANKAGVEINVLKLNKLSDLWISEAKIIRGHEFDKIEVFEKIPYNYIDEGRIILSIPRCNRGYDVILGSDPRVEKEPIPHLKNVLSSYIDSLTKDFTTLNAIITDKELTMTYQSYELSVFRNQTDVKYLQMRLKALRKMVDEYKYIIQKQKAEGTDVNISDRIKYNHSEGKITYNDFSIAIDDELIKRKLFEAFKIHLIEYYREEVSEETIINDLLDRIFKELKERVLSYSVKDTTINIKFNDKINVKLDIKTTKNSSRLLYLNNQRFNQNEVVMILREITCYRSQEEADRFISNIGKLGLSVYIGITSGYETIISGSKKLFKFKKLKGRSNYVLLLDTVEIPIKGKELINILFSKFIGYVCCDDKILDIIYKSVTSTSDYIKYKFLIDTTYEAFRKRSEDFLKKKVSDVQGEFVKYYDANNRKNMQAITLVGMSGHRYIIAYNEKDSYVFMDPEFRKNENVYENGKYVCMIDQSNIKSNIGFDTVISKLLALKNDSVIAKTIYNLKEELNE